MSKQLIENIIEQNYIQAEYHFHDTLNAIMEQKLYQEKRRIASLQEIVKPVPGKPGEFTGANTKADWAKYRKQTKIPKTKPVEPTPAEFGSGKRLSKGDIERRRKAGYAQAYPYSIASAFVKKVRKYKETGKLDESTPALRGLERDVAAINKAAPEPAQTPKRDMSAVKTSVVKSKKDSFDMSPWARRAALEKKRQEKISSDPKAAKRLMTGREKIKSFVKRAAKGGAAGFADALRNLEEQEG